MKLIAQLSLLTILLAACAAPPADMPAASPAPSTQTVTPSATASPALDLTPFDIAQDEPETPTPDTPDTPTITPLPTIPTFTPTFDARTIVTATPAPRAECPQVVSLPPDADLGFLDLSYDKPENRKRENVEANILKFLNLYGAAELKKISNSLWGFNDAVLVDLTNNSEPEIILEAIALYVFGCQNGEYKNLLELPYATLIRIWDSAIFDLNQNGIPEITVMSGVASQGGHSYAIFEWDGEKFANLIISDDPNYPDDGSIWMEVGGKIYHVEENGKQNLIAESGIPTWTTYHDGLPWRNERTIYSWNGKNYVPDHREFESPEFRFQAIQDGDLALSQQEYAKAIELYQQAIFNAELKAYSSEIRKNLADTWAVSINPDNKPSPTPVSPDPTEYPRLAAYAYYRMIILHTFLGEMDAAQVKYATLQEKFPAGSPGHPYVEMATDFWNAWQSSGRMYDACAAAIAYADAHPEILVPLGSDYHGAQSHRYQPADVCPFR